MMSITLDQLAITVRRLKWTGLFDASVANDAIQRRLEPTHQTVVSDKTGSRTILTSHFHASHSNFHQDGITTAVTLLSKDNGIYFTFDCDCEQPMCIHAFSALHALALRGTSEAPDKFMLWMGALDPDIAKPPNRSSEVGADLCVDLLLSSAERTPGTGTPRLYVIPYVSPRMGALQGRGAVEHLSPEEFRDYGLLCAVRVDQNAHFQAYTSSARFRMVSPEQDAALLRTLDRRHVHLEGMTKLRRGPDLPLHPGWVIQASGRQRLALLDPQGREPKRLVRGGDAIFYLQDDQLGIALCDPRIVDTIAKAPVVLPQHSRAVAKAIAATPEHGNPIALPPPHDATTIKDHRGAPKPVLRIGQEASGAVNASLVYRYGDVEVQPAEFGSENILLRATDKGLRRIKRNLKAEKLALTVLEAKGVHSPRPKGRSRYEYSDPLDSSFRLQDRFAKDPIALINSAAAKLEDAGIEVKHDFTVVDIDREPHELTSIAEDGNQWFTIQMAIEVAGVTYDLTTVLQTVLADPDFSLSTQDGEDPAALWTMRLTDGTLARMPVAKLRTLVAPIAEWLEQGSAIGKGGTLRVSRMQMAMVAEDLHLARAAAVPELRAAIARLRIVADEPPPKAPRGFVGKLRPYQADGLHWLNALEEGGLGGILADDMGLGKTVQVLAHLQWMKVNGHLPHPAMILAPASVVHNWMLEAAKFTPDLRALQLTGPTRSEHFLQLQEYDLVVSSYPCIRRDIDALAKHKFTLLVPDEAQEIRNPTTSTAIAVRRLSSSRVLPLTGTPVQNHLLDLWASMDLALPGLMGDQKHFTKAYRTPIEKRGDAERQQRLNHRIRPFMLRRTKDLVAKDLPPKTEMVRLVKVEGAQRELYVSIAVAQQERVKAAIAERGINQAQVQILDALLKLRQVCGDPRLVKLDSARKVKGSAKLDELKALLIELMDEKRRVLVVSSFVEMLELIRDDLEQMGIEYRMLTGDTPTGLRPSLVAEFQTGSIPVMLLSLKAGGVGLNLTAADTVIHYDPWWNPAAEDQATDRAHRIGQDKPVFVYRLIVEGTVEERMQALKARKSRLANAVLDGGTTTSIAFDAQDIEDLFSARPTD